MVTFTELELTEQEYALVQAVRDLEFGTLDNIEVPDAPRLGFQAGVSCQESRMIEAIREGWRDIRRIQVHQGEPAYMEVATVINGFMGTRRFKFN